MPRLRAAESHSPFFELRQLTSKTTK